jgi:hypothetical protein
MRFLSRLFCIAALTVSAHGTPARVGVPVLVATTSGLLRGVEDNGRRLNPCRRLMNQLTPQQYRSLRA